jgi:hypothetical protein
MVDITSTGTGDVKLVLVHWVDSSGGEGWVPMSAIKENWDELKVTTVGWLIEESEEAILVVPHIAKCGNHLQGRGDLSIPVCAITEYTVLEEHDCKEH